MFGFYRKGKRRLEKIMGRHARVDGIPFKLPVKSSDSPAVVAAFSVDAEKAKSLFPGHELHPFRTINNKALLILTVLDYRNTNIGKYIEYSVALACTHGHKPAPRILPMLFPGYYGLGQYVVDLPVSSEISVKGGKGIWGMPKHQANLDFIETEDTVSSQYDLDGMMVLRLDVKKPKKAWLPLRIGTANYCTFRGMLQKSYVYFKTKCGVSLAKKGAKLYLGEHPRLSFLKDMDVSENPVFVAYLPEFEGLLDDYMESWFICHDDKPEVAPAGLESVTDLGLSEDWLAPPNRKEIFVEEEAKLPLGLTFSETMTGHFSLAVEDPTEGCERGKSHASILSMHATVKIDDLDKFIKDPEHRGSISGTIDFTGFGKNITCNNGKFNLFSPAEDPDMRYMVYELGFVHHGKSYYLAGKKHVKNDNGLDLWSDTTTLYTYLHEGMDDTGPIVGAGILSLGVPDLMRLVPTMRVLNAEGPLEQAEGIASFGRFFMGELWDRYAPLAKRR